MKLPSNPTSCWRLFEEQAMAVVTSKSFFFASCLPEQPCKPVPCSTPVCQCLGSHHPPNMPGFLPTATIYSHPHLPRTHTHTHPMHQDVGHRREPVRTTRLGELAPFETSDIRVLRDTSTPSWETTATMSMSHCHDLPRPELPDCSDYS